MVCCAFDRDFQNNPAACSRVRVDTAPASLVRTAGWCPSPLAPSAAPSGGPCLSGLWVLLVWAVFAAAAQVQWAPEDPVRSGPGAWGGLCGPGGRGSKPSARKPRVLAVKPQVRLYDREGTWFSRSQHHAAPGRRNEPQVCPLQHSGKAALVVSGQQPLRLKPLEEHCRWRTQRGAPLSPATSPPRIGLPGQERGGKPARTRTRKAKKVCKGGYSSYVGRLSSSFLKCLGSELFWLLLDLGVFAYM